MAAAQLAYPFQDLLEDLCGQGQEIDTEDLCFSLGALPEGTAKGAGEARFERMESQGVVGGLASFAGSMDGGENLVVVLRTGQRTRAVQVKASQLSRALDRGRSACCGRSSFGLQSYLAGPLGGLGAAPLPLQACALAGSAIWALSVGSEARGAVGGAVRVAVEGEFESAPSVAALPSLLGIVEGLFAAEKVVAAAGALAAVGEIALAVFQAHEGWREKLDRVGGAYGVLDGALNIGLAVYDIYAHGWSKEAGLQLAGGALSVLNGSIKLIPHLGEIGLLKALGGSLGGAMAISEGLIGIVDVWKDPQNKPRGRRIWLGFPSAFKVLSGVLMIGGVVVGGPVGAAIGLGGGLLYGLGYLMQLWVEYDRDGTITLSVLDITLKWVVAQGRLTAEGLFSILAWIAGDPEALSRALRACGFSDLVDDLKDSVKKGFNDLVDAVENGVDTAIDGVSYAGEKTVEVAKKTAEYVDQALVGTVGEENSHIAFQVGITSLIGSPVIEGIFFIFPIIIKKNWSIFHKDRSLSPFFPIHNKDTTSSWKKKVFFIQNKSLFKRPVESRLKICNPEDYKSIYHKSLKGK